MSRSPKAGRASACALAMTTVLAVVMAPAAFGMELPPGCAQSGSTVTCTYTEGSNAFVVPDGVSQVHVVAIGGRGAASTGASSAPGGAGARLSADLAVDPGGVLYAVVGGDAAGTSGASTAAATAPEVAAAEPVPRPRARVVRVARRPRAVPTARTTALSASASWVAAEAAERVPHTRAAAPAPPGHPTA